MKTLYCVTSTNMQGFRESSQFINADNADDAIRRAQLSAAPAPGPLLWTAIDCKELEYGDDYDGV